jgi:Flp pilus assembly pilin Flp
MAERGQATVEFALVLPLVAVVLTIGVEVVGVGLDHLALTQWTREVARSSAIASSTFPELSVARPQRLRDADVHVDVDHVATGVGEVVNVTATLSESIDLPFPRASLFRHELRANASMWVEHSP